MRHGRGCPRRRACLTAMAMCARRFLLLVFILTLIVVAAAFAMFQFGSSALTRIATPQGQFVAPPPRSGPDYAAPANWIARPDLPAAGNPALWQPTPGPTPDVTPAAAPDPAAPALAPPSTEANAHVFYIHPTTYLER